jgi:hypothetical protein
MKIGNELRFDDAAAPSAPEQGAAAPASSSADTAALRAELAARDAELSRMRMEHQSLNRNWEAAKNLLSPENTDPNSVESNFRTAMAGAGFSQDQIEAQLEAYHAARSSVSSDDEEGDSGVNEEVASRLANMEVEQQRISNETNMARRGQLEGLMNSSLSMAVDSNKDLNTLIKRLSSLDGDEQSLQSRKAVIASEVRNEATRLLREQRQLAGGNWSDQWIPAATQRAAEIVHKKYRTVIGDPSRIGRVTETDAGEFLASRPPVKPPEYRKGMSMEDAGKSVRDFAVDALLRGVASKENSI